MLIPQPEQIRAARALLNWSQPQLAQAAGLGLSTVVDFEKTRRKVADSSVAGMAAALERSGVIFIPENGQGPGVRLKKEP